MMQQAGGMDVNALMKRIQRLAMLDTTVFDEVRGDQSMTIPAVIVAIVSTFLFGLGGFLWFAVNVDSEGSYISNGDVFLKSFIVGSILAIVLWGVWVGITYVMLTQLFRARADVNELVRVMGFATAPLALGVLMLIPQLDFAIGLSVLALFFGTTFVAVQSATDAAAGRTLIAVAAGFAVWAIILCLFVGDENWYAPGFFIFEFGAQSAR
jgi:hypothetical protein